MRKVWKVSRTVASIALEVFVSLVAIYLITYVILSRVPIAEKLDNSTKSEKIAVFVSSNGVHTDFMLPIKHEWKDWSIELHLEKAILIDTFQTHFAIGWGDLNFFLKTKEWSDLSVGTAASAMFGLGEGAIHVVLCSPRDKDPKDLISLKLSKSSYLKLCAYIRSSLLLKQNETIEVSEHPYGPYHHFFQSTKTYSMFYTCNSWTNTGLKEAGQKACLWTPFKDGIYARYGK